MQLVRRLNMGYSISWLACRGLPFEGVTSRLSLSTTDRHDEFARAIVSAQALDNGWHLLVANRCNHNIIKTPSLAALSVGCEVIACAIEEHVMYSSAECWRDGQRIWHVEHSSEEGENHLAVEGKPPDCLAQLVADTERKQAEDSEVGWFFEIPLDCAKTLVGFKHDEDNPILDRDAFLRLEPLQPERKWWQFWK